MRTRIIMLIVVCAVLAIGIATWRRGRQVTGQTESILAEVRSGPLIISVKGSGNIRAKNSSKIIPKVNRGVMISFLVPDGTRVSSNEVVARFVTDDVDRRLSELESAFTDSQSKFDAAQSDCEIQLMDNATTQKKAEQDVRTARMELEKLTQGDEPLDRRNCELKVQNADSELTRKQKRHEDLKSLLKEGFVTEDEVEEQRIAVESAKVAQDTTKIELKILNEYTMPLKRATVEGAAARALAELEKTTKQNATRMQARTQALELAKKALERSKTALELTRKERDEYEVKSPSAGVVMYGNPDEMWRRGDIQVGGQFQPGQVLMTIPDMSTMQATVNIPEADIYKVTTGQTARVTV
ncbi:MAG: efflux RND transporter periplasmic adaptor subunit, partial [bacterium]